MASGLVRGPSCEMIIESFHCCILVQRWSHECSQEDEEEYTIMSNTHNSFSISHQRLCPRTFLRSKSNLSIFVPRYSMGKSIEPNKKTAQNLTYQNQFTHLNSSTWLDAYKNENLLLRWVLGFHVTLIKINVLIFYIWKLLVNK